MYGTKKAALWSDGCAGHEIHEVSIVSRILVERRIVLLTKL